MEPSILKTIKRMLGLDPEDETFDVDILVLINAALMSLQQLGVGPAEGFSVTSANELWSDFMTDDRLYQGIREYIYLKVRLVFDPPSSSSVADALKKNLDELEWRLIVQTGA
jgi:hypothetical protein